MSHRHLTPRERFAIEQLRLGKHSFREIGRRLKRHHSTIAREVARNMSRHAGATYIWQRGEASRAGAPMQAASSETVRPRAVEDLCLAGDPRGMVARAGFGAVACRPSTLLGDADRCGDDLSLDLPRCGPWRHAPPLPAATPETAQGLAVQGCWPRFDPGRIGIETRPPRVDLRRHFGDWEGDLLLGRQGGAALLTMIDRRSRYILASKLKDRKAPSVVCAIATLIGPFSETHAPNPDAGQWQGVRQPPRHSRRNRPRHLLRRSLQRLAARQH